MKQLPERKSKTKELRFMGNFREKNSYRGNEFRENNRGSSNNDNRSIKFQRYDNQNAETTLKTGNVAGPMRQQLFHRMFAIHVVILVTHRENVKREAEAFHEVNSSRSTCSLKTKNATHVRQPKRL